MHVLQLFFDLHCLRGHSRPLKQRLHLSDQDLLSDWHFHLHGLPLQLRQLRLSHPMFHLQLHPFPLPDLHLLPLHGQLLRRPQQLALSALPLLLQVVQHLRGVSQLRCHQK